MPLLCRWGSTSQRHGQQWELVSRHCPRPTESGSVFKRHPQVICPLNLGSTTLWTTRILQSFSFRKGMTICSGIPIFGNIFSFFLFPGGNYFSPKCHWGAFSTMTFMEDPTGIWNIRALLVCDSQIDYIFSGRHCIVFLVYTCLKFLLLLSNYNQLYFFSLPFFHGRIMNQAPTQRKGPSCG